MACTSCQSLQDTNRSIAVVRRDVRHEVAHAARSTVCASAVPIIQIRLAHPTVLATTKPVPVRREPSIKQVNQRSDEWNPEQPRYQSPLRQNIQQLLERGRRLPRFTVASPHHLHRFHVRARRNPRKPLPNTGRLRRNDFELMIPIPPGQHLHHPAAHFAVTVIDHRVTPTGLTNGRRNRMVVRVLTGCREADDLNAHADASIAGDFTPTASTEICGGCVSVL